MASGERIVDLEEIEESIHQTMIVRKAMDEQTSVVYFSPDPDSPREGIKVRLPPVIQATYRCNDCPHIVVVTFFLPDVLNRNVASSKLCTDCRGKMRLAALGPERERPVVIREKPKVGIEEFIED